ncbi:hypothetical protein N7481_013314 [Penicillium waksmanii]|uniref:uncharacterized protein n=1 Tax=Penicillium waksmanii TaxID=69791 RepID=UPI0025485340|nr:uncharacterized protein N7481_013314 [Penicillium waksmanii]KAJ5966600.1 hypothetical protein N7481_013314 [Penicillium waksmanii]
MELMSFYRNPPVNQNLFLDILGRLDRLEKHCSLSASAGSSASQRPPLSEDPLPIAPSPIQNIVNCIKDEDTRHFLLFNIFCCLGQLNSCFFIGRSIRAITSAISEIESLQNTQSVELLGDPDISKSLAKRLIENHYGRFQFEGFQYPLKKDFLAAIPDLIDNPHIQLDHTSQIIYYSILLRACMLDAEAHPRRGNLIQTLYSKCVALSDDWMENIQDTSTDLLAVSLMISIALEGCNIDLAWKAFSHSCRVAKALGYFSVDEFTSAENDQQSIPVGTPAPEAEVERNRKRFGFWHILRTDCIFRMSFGKPTLIPAGSWKVDLPDPTINGVDDGKSNFIQIHFISSMRLALIVMRYLDWIERDAQPDPVSHDTVIDGYIDEVQSILSDWDMESLLRMATEHIDIWLCVDVLFNSYTMLIVLYQSKKCNRGDSLPYPATDLARKSVKTFQTLLECSSQWGISLILLYQFIPFFVLCLNILGNSACEYLDEDLMLVNWVFEYVEVVVQGRVELQPVVIIMKAMVTACRQTKTDLLARSDATFAQ